MTDHLDCKDFTVNLPTRLLQGVATAISWNGQRLSFEESAVLALQQWLVRRMVPVPEISETTLHTVKATAMATIPGFGMRPESLGADDLGEHQDAEMIGLIERILQDWAIEQMQAQEFNNYFNGSTD